MPGRNALCGGQSGGGGRCFPRVAASDSPQDHYERLRRGTESLNGRAHRCHVRQGQTLYFWGMNALGLMLSGEFSMRLTELRVAPANSRLVQAEPSRVAELPRIVSRENNNASAEDVCFE